MGHPAKRQAVLQALHDEVALPVLGTALVTELCGDGRAILSVGGRPCEADIDASVHPVVIASAHRRQERVLVESRGDRHLVVGALRTQPVPGIDRADTYTIQADRLTLEAAEVHVLATEMNATGEHASAGARIVLRAAGEIESFAERIVTRASGVHKLIGRMLRLN